MRVLFQYLTGGGGGLANFIALLRALAETFPDDHLDLVCSPNSELQKLSSLPNVEVIPYGDGAHPEIARARLGFGALNALAENRKADVLWSLNIGSYVRGRIPHVLSVNNPHQVCPWPLTRYHPKNRAHVAALRWFFRRSLASADGVIVQTAAMGEAVQRFARPPRPLCVAPKAVDTASDKVAGPLPPSIARALGAAPRAFTFLYVATGTPHKRHDTLAKAMQLLVNEGIDARAVVTLEPQELIALAGSRATPLVASGRLIPIGWAKPSFLKTLYDAADACVMPSVLESLSSAHLEAMQWGKPQVTSEMPYARDVCGDAAIYADPERPDDWVVQMKRLMNDPQLRAELQTRGHERMKAYPATWTDVAQRVRHFLHEARTGT